MFQTRLLLHHQPSNLLTLSLPFLTCSVFLLLIWLLTLYCSDGWRSSEFLLSSFPTSIVYYFHYFILPYLLYLVYLVQLISYLLSSFVSHVFCLMSDVFSSFSLSFVVSCLSFIFLIAPYLMSCDVLFFFVNCGPILLAFLYWMSYLYCLEQHLLFSLMSYLFLYHLLTDSWGRYLTYRIQYMAVRNTWRKCIPEITKVEMTRTSYNNSLSLSVSVTCGENILCTLVYT